MPSVPTQLFSKHPEFFFADGNVVIIAGFLSFRLHRGIVNRWSPVFSAMLNALDSATDPWTFEGIKVAVLDDDPHDVERLVRVLHDGSGDLTCTAKSFPTLSSVLVLSHKYNIAQLRTHALARLLVAYPVTLADWDIREAYEFAPAERYERLSGLRTRFVHPLAVVSLALRLGAPDLLVPAYLDLARFPASEVIRGYTTSALRTTSTSEPTSTQTLHLPHKQTTAVLRGKEVLQRFIADFITTSVESHEPSPICHYAEQLADAEGNDLDYPCATAFERVAHEMLVMTATVSGGVDSDPLFVLQCAVEILKESEGDHGCVWGANTQKEGEVIEGTTAGLQADEDNGASEENGGEGIGGNRATRKEGACAACTEAFKQQVGVARQYVWANLGMWFDLEKVLEHGFEAGGWE